MRPRLTYANVMATIAVFIALGGASYAATQLPKNSVGTKQIKNNAVNGSKVANGSLAGQDFAADQLPQGPQGPPGPSTGPASGDLTGSYPDPQIAPDAVTSSKIADEAVTSADLAHTETVHSVTLKNCVGSTPWKYGEIIRPPGFWKDPTGLVHLQGAVSCGGDATEGGAIFSLPEGFQPVQNQGLVRFGVLGAGAVLVQIAILDDGSGNVVYDGPDNTTVDNYVSLDGVTFRP